MLYKSAPYKKFNKSQAKGGKLIGDRVARKKCRYLQKVGERRVGLNSMSQLYFDWERDPRNVLTGKLVSHPESTPALFVMNAWIGVQRVRSRVME